MSSSDRTYANLCQLFFLFLSSAVFAQDTAFVTPKLPPARIGFVSEYNIERSGSDSVETIDSSLSHFYLFDKFLYNITKEKNIFTKEENVFYIGKGIVSFSNDITAPYKFSNRTIKYYKLNRRFTEVTYLSGSKSEQMLNVIYSQNLIKGWNAGLDFRRAGAEGFFRRQRFYQSSFDFYTHYESPNMRYSLSAYYLRNHLEQQENGGIKNFNPAENTVAQPTYLSSAENKQTDKEFFLRQTFRLNKAVRDSALPAENPGWSVGHSIRYDTKGTIYSEASTDSFYQNSFFDSTSTNDSTWYQRWSNEIFFNASQDDSAKLPLAFSISAGHEYVIYKFGIPSILFIPGQKENFYGAAAINFGNVKTIKFSTHVRYVFSGENEGDYDGEATVSKSLLSEKWNISLNAFAVQQQPNLWDTRRYSNHFIWFNYYSAIQSAKGTASISTTDKSFSLSVSLNTVNNFVYYNFLSQPVQIPVVMNYYSATLQKNFTLGYWHLDNKINWQKADDIDKIHLPEFMTGHSLYFEKKIFKKAMFARIGTDLRYVSAYNADDYNPALQQFYIQHWEETGGYALLDLYVNFRVKASLFFIKAENLLSGVSDKAYFYRPDYPVTPRVIRFGLQFRFYD